MRTPFAAIAALALALDTATIFGQPMAIEKLGDSLVDAQGLQLGDPAFPGSKFATGAINGVSYQQEALISHAGWQYVGYYNGDRRVCLARRKLPEGEWQVIRFTDYHFRSNDGHNIISLGICPADGTIHLSFDHHASVLKYRLSKPGIATHPESVEWTASQFLPIRNWLENPKVMISGVTYPCFFQTPTGGLQLTYRGGGSGNGLRFLADYQPGTGNWSTPSMVDTSVGTYRHGNREFNSRCSYHNGYTYGPKGRLHVTWGWRESGRSVDTNRDLMYAYSEDLGKTWCNNDGQLLELPISMESPGIKVWDLPMQTSGTGNQMGQTVDSQERIHVILRHYPVAHLEAVAAAAGKPPANPTERRFVHYWRQPDGIWHQTELPGRGGSRPKIFTDKTDNAYVITQAGGALIVIGATAASQWTDWQEIYREKGPFSNEMLGDPYLWQKDCILSVFVQEARTDGFAPTPIRIIDLRIHAGPQANQQGQ